MNNVTRSKHHFLFLTLLVLCLLLLVASTTFSSGLRERTDARFPEYSVNQQLVSGKLDSILQAEIDEGLDESLAVIVQKRSEGTAVEQAVEALGGTVTKDLPIINSVAATIPATAIETLAGNTSVHFISSDGQVATSTADITYNRLVNPDFEAGLAGWANTNSTISADAYTGNNALATSGYAEQTFLAVVDETYTFSLWAKAVAGSGEMGLSFYRDNGQLLAEYSETITSNGYQSYILTQAVPTHAVQMVAWVRSDTSNSLILADNVVLANSNTQNLFANPSFESKLEGWQIDRGAFRAVRQQTNSGTFALAGQDNNHNSLSQTITIPTDTEALTFTGWYKKDDYGRFKTMVYLF